MLALAIANASDSFSLSTVSEQGPHFSLLLNAGLAQSLVSWERTELSPLCLYVARSGLAKRLQANGEVNRDSLRGGPWLTGCGGDRAAAERVRRRQPLRVQRAIVAAHVLSTG